MNDLSWFLYLAEVLPRLSGVLGSIGLFGGLLFLFCAGVRYVVNHDGFNVNECDKNKSKDFMKFTTYKVLPVFITLFVASFLIPSKETIYLIAGSEASEYVVTSEYGREVLGDIKDIIKAQLNNLKETK